MRKVEELDLDAFAEMEMQEGRHIRQVLEMIRKEFLSTVYVRGQIVQFGFVPPDGTCWPFVDACFLS